VSALLLPGVQSQIGPLQRIIAAEYAGQESSGPMLRTWGAAGPAEIPAFNSPGTTDGPGELQARELLSDSEQEVLAATDLFDLRTGPVELWYRPSSTRNTSTFVGTTHDRSSVGNTTQWAMIQVSNGYRLFVLNESNDFVTTDGGSPTAEVFTRIYVDHHDNVTTLRVNGEKDATEQTITNNEVNHFALGCPAQITRISGALLRKYTRPLTEAEHACMLANPVMAKDLRGANP